MMGPSTNRTVALVSALALSACSGPPRPASEDSVTSDSPASRLRAGRVNNPDELAKECPWNVGERLADRNSGEKLFKLAGEVVRNGIAPTLKEHGEQWYQLPAQGGGSYVVRSQSVSEIGDQAESLCITIIPITEHSHGRFIAQLTFTPDGQLINAPIGETAVRPETTDNPRVVRTSADNQVLLSDISSLVIASAGTENALAVPAGDKPGIEKLFDQRQAALDAMLHPNR